MPTAIDEQALELCGGVAERPSSRNQGLIPVPLSRVPPGALQGLELFVREDSPEYAAIARLRAGGAPSDTVGFAPAEIETMQKEGARIVYIRTADHARFQRQVEEALGEAVENPSLAKAAKATLVYETSIELLNELLPGSDVAEHLPRLEQVSDATVRLVLGDAAVFSQLFQVARHDFYTATHAVNVATWMVSLAHALGYRDRQELANICIAGLLHDIGKLQVPAEILNKATPLSTAEWQQIHAHTVLGAARLCRADGVPAIACVVARQHHERLDGRGYPDGLKGNEIDRPSRICAVVDSFDAMTAVRPYKAGVRGAAEVLDFLEGRPNEYDSRIVKAWREMLGGAHQTVAAPQPAAAEATQARDRRGLRRYPCQVLARAFLLAHDDGAPIWRDAQEVIVHNVSRTGLGLLTNTLLREGDFVAIRLPLGPGKIRTKHGYVIRCRHYSDGAYEVGIEFARTSRKPSAAQR